MRVVSGTAKGCALKSVPGDTTRPILDRVKTALFDILRPRLDGTLFLDLFAGSGAVGIEALSQGAAFALFVDVVPAATATIRENLQHCRLLERAEIRNTDAFLLLRKSERIFDLVYVAPPQYQGIWVQALHALSERPEVVKRGGLVIAQIDPAEYETLELKDFRETRQAKYGKTLLVFFERCAEDVFDS